MTSTIFFIFGTILILYLALCIAVKYFQNRLIITPGPAVDITPEIINMEYEEVWISSQNHQEKIHGWWIDTNKDSAPTVLYLHGNATSLSDHIEITQLFNSMSFNCLIIDYRGYGKSEGDFPTEQRMYEDAASAYLFLTHNKKINPNQLIVHGHSLGGAIALDIVSHYHLAGAIIESSFTSIRDMSKRKKIYRFLPISLILNQEFDSLEKVKKISIPLLFMHGEKDRFVSSKMGKLLYKHSISNDKKIVLFSQGGHANLKIVEEEKYIKSISKFIEEKTKNA
ncbi:MAG: alpha/beta fold hydrolase [Cyanobacteria bacterium P01_F01_bin.150]